MSEAPRGKVWFEGRVVDWEKAKIHFISHIAQYGTGVFEGIRAYDTHDGPAIFRLREHIDRFYHSAKCYRMNIPYSKGEIIEACRTVVKTNNLKDAYIRPLAYKDTSNMSLDALEAETKVSIGAWPWAKYLGKAYTEGAQCIVSSWRRIPPFSLPTTSKASGHYLNSQLARMEATEKGCDEAIMLDYRGYVSEGTGENIIIVKDGQLYTPPIEASILIGITRDTVFTIVEDMDYSLRERNILRSELYGADEIFFAGTAAEITPVIIIDDIEIGSGKPGPITQSVQKRYEEAVRGKIERYSKWLTYV